VQTVDLDAEGDGATPPQVYTAGFTLYMVTIIEIYSVKPPQIVFFAVGAGFEPLVLAQKHLTTLEAQPTALKLLEVPTR
jgi:hypothetical protein